MKTYDLTQHPEIVALLDQVEWLEEVLRQAQADERVTGRLCILLLTVRATLQKDVWGTIYHLTPLHSEQRLRIEGHRVVIEEPSEDGRDGTLDGTMARFSLN